MVLRITGLPVINKIGGNMKPFVFFLLAVAIAIPAFAEWYIVNQDNEVVSTASKMPDAADLESRNEIAVFVKDAVPFSEAEYRNGKIVKHVETTKEKEAKQERLEKIQEEQMIIQKLRENAIKELKAEGVDLKHYSEECPVGGCGL